MLLLDDTFDKIKKKFSIGGKKYNSLKRNQKLILNLRRKKKPDLVQLKHISKILSLQEKRIIFSLSLIVFFCLGAIIFLFIKRHIITVPANTGEYIEGVVGFPRLINPLYAQTNDVDSDLEALLFSGLMKYDKDLKLVPDLASEYKISEDQKTYTFVLRDDIFFHNGNKLTADDIIFTVEAIKDPLYKSSLYLTFKSIKISKIDERTIEFFLQEPYSPFLNLLTFGILPENIWAEVPVQNAALAEYNIKPIGTGPYKINSFSKDKIGNLKNYTLERFDGYYGQHPYIKLITFKFYPDFNSVFFALKGKEIQSASFLPKNIREELTENKNILIRPLNLPQYTSIFFNQDHNEILKDKRMRLALTQGINKKALLEENLNNEGIIIDGPILPDFIGYNPDLKKYEYNPQEANKLLDEAGWEKINSDDFIKSEKERLEKELNGKNEEIKKLGEEGEEEEKENTKTSIEKMEQEINDINHKLESLAKYGMQTFLRKKSGKLLELALTTVNSGDSVRVAESIKDYWEDIGLFTDLRIEEPQDIEKNVIKTREYDCLLYGEIIGADPDPYPFWHSSQNKYPGLNLAIFSNEEVDKLLEEARTTNDEQKRKDKYVHFQNILVQELPAIFLYSPTYSYILSSKVEGFSISKIYLPCDRFTNIEDWYVEKKQTWTWK
ncbi:MAG: ABC transporter substrate-binding protein [bacterium]